MCGRYSLDTTWAEVHAFMQPIELITPEEPLEPAYNIAPTQLSWVLRPDAGVLKAERMRWGLLPSWAKDPKLAYSTINARAESMASKPAFRQAFAKRRCLVLASGYYEWITRDGHKQPYYLHPRSAPLLLMAGLWEPPLRREGAPAQASYSIVTVDAHPRIAELHDRMPLMFEAQGALPWLQLSPAQAGGLANNERDPDIAWHAVDPAVGNVRNQGRQLCEPRPT